jgi:hypothetical protein
MRKPIVLILGSLVMFFVVLTAYFSFDLFPHTASAAPLNVSGTVFGTSGPLADAVIQLQGTPRTVHTSQLGSFTMDEIDGGKPFVLTAWYEGYYVGWAKLDPTSAEWNNGDGIEIKLKPLAQTDNIKYPWFTFEGVKGSDSCGLCHREFEEWKADAHAQAAVNPRFISIYRGTDVEGRESQAIRWDSQAQALPPDPDMPYYGPGYRLDNPQRAGNCATCHTPMAAKISNQNNCGWSGCHTDLTAERAPQYVDMGVIPLHLTGDAAEGINCDFCHKIGGVILEPDTRLPKADMPGILSMELYRPEDGEQIFFGTMIDVTRRVSYSPLQEKSEFCAPCHYGVFGGVVGHGVVRGGVLIYNSYGEWLDSVYSDPETGQSCQDCHMPVLDTQVSVFPEKGGILRDYVEFNDHKMLGVTDVEFMQNAVSMTSKAERMGDTLAVEVSIFNNNTGHHIPTDAPIRSMMLVVEAFDQQGNLLAIRQGQLLPDWAGNYAGIPGKAFAKVLRDEWTGEAPTSAYWRPVTILEDTRIPAMVTDVSQFTFDLPAGEEAQVKVRLVFRRAFQELMEQKGWSDPDILMKEEMIQVKR